MNSAKAELLEVRKLCLKIYQLYREKESLLGITRNIQSDERVQKSTGSGGLEATVLERDRIQKEIDKAMSLYISERQQIIDRIHQTDKEEYIQVLYKRYIEGKSFEAIKREMHYEVSYLRKLHVKALNAYIKTM
ncbi:hypothetical protein [Lachnoanaerobaculum umeaense]|jgi:hypothetical protein|uniref:Uncharacterized protein n=1 Tax=Lachnoanaerobaculum umeaense TaxID=617123 RepID=A0A385Q2A6_9FIRM|nr:hypothetical protein [Lachnoanaerobaculum umeaense]AYB00227.1 hypothetical protein D4A81_09925 [Lachnoanaerobaculum umeaense]PZW96737.1 hypothetical protein C7439_11164 [Lachnoanaerobaculum umeaense]DAP77959.1 MAG TPA: Protein of unknown function (DUF722) [Caudoviricetes sp.]